MFAQTTPLHKLLGLAASTGIAWSGQMLATIPVWAEHTKDWAAVILTVVGVFGACNYGAGLFLDNRKKWREERAAHREELREIEDAVCKKRQADGQCLRCGWEPPKT